MHKQSSLSSSEFTAFGLDARLLRALEKLKFKTPSPIQQQMIPEMLAGHDVIGQARTGTGKTAAFGLPILQNVSREGRLQAVVVAPTRELAIQVSAEIQRLGQFTDLHCVPIYGGQRIQTQLHALGRKPHIVVGTPGRMLDLLSRKALNFDSVRYVVLDEVDRMLDIGFRDDIRRILSQVRTEHVTVFVSATIEDEVRRLATSFAKDPVELNVSRDSMTVGEVSQYYMTADPWDKFHLLRMLLKREKPGLAIVFTNTKHAARKLAKKLYDAGINAKDIHGDLMQSKREKIMGRFRRRQIQILVATDLAARGLDISDVSHIINYDVPRDREIYVHRIGRTARMGAEGKAFTFITHEEGKELTEIEKLINMQIEEDSVDGFKPRPPREEPDEAKPVSAPPSRFQQPVSGTPAAVATAPRTLGGKFKPRRKRRL